MQATALHQFKKIQRGRNKSFSASKRSMFAFNKERIKNLVSTDKKLATPKVGIFKKMYNWFKNKAS